MHAGSEDNAGDANAASFEGMLPTRLTTADRDQIERRTQEIGRGLLERSLKPQFPIGGEYVDQE